MKNFFRSRRPIRPDATQRDTSVDPPRGPGLDPLSSSPRENRLSESWSVWKEATCKRIFTLHGPQCESSRDDFARRELLPYFEADLSPLEAERAWWRALCMRRHRTSPSSPADRDPIIDPDHVSIRSVYDSVLIRNAAELRRTLALLEKRDSTRAAPYIAEARKRLRMMEDELARRRKRDA